MVTSSEISKQKYAGLLELPGTFHNFSFTENACYLPSFPLPVHDGFIVMPRHHSGIHHLPHRLLCPLPICSSAQLAPQDRLCVSAASAAVTEWSGEALDSRYW